MAKLKVLASHPVQYQAPFLQELIKAGLEVEVGFYHQGAALSPQIDTQFGIAVQWDIDLLGGYPHRFFKQGFANFSIREQLTLLPALALWSLRNRNEPLLLIGWFAHIIWIIWLLRILLNYPTLIYGDNTLASYEAVPKPASRKWLLRWLITHSHACMYVGQRNREFYQMMGAESSRLYHMPHSIDNTRFHEAVQREHPDRKKWCTHYKLNAHLPTFLFCGKLTANKRPFELLQAYYAAGLQDKTQLIYVGEGQQRSIIEQFIQTKNLENVHLLGFFNQSQMPTAYVLGEVLCLLSEGETWGLVVNEALACGRPAIVSDTVGCAADLITPETGWVVPFDDPQKLIETMQDAYKQRESWREMGDRGRQLIADYNFGAMAEGIMAALQDIDLLGCNRKS